MKQKEVISNYGLFATICVTVIGVGGFSYPSAVTKEVGTDGWIVSILGGILCFLLLYLIYKVVKINDYNTFYEILENNLGKFLAKVVSLILGMYFIVSFAFGMRIFVEVIKMYLLQQTPTEFILLVMIFTGTYLVRGGVNSLMRFNEIIFWIMFIPMFIVLAFSCRNGDFTNILPVFQNDPIDYVRGLAVGSYSFLGFEIAYLVIPLVKDKKKIGRTLLKSSGFIAFFYMIITILCIAFFGVKHSIELLWPTITLIRSIVIPGAFVERWEGIVMAIWILFYFTTFVNRYYFSAELFKNAFSLGDIKLSCLVIVPITYIIALYPQNIAELYDSISKFMLIAAPFSFILLPLILLVIGRFKGRGGSYDKS